MVQMTVPPVVLVRVKVKQVILLTADQNQVMLMASLASLDHRLGTKHRCGKSDRVVGTQRKETKAEGLPP